MRQVPLHPPRGMFLTHLLEGAALEEGYLGEDADELYDRRKCRYSEFSHTQLLQRVSPAAFSS